MSRRRTIGLLLGVLVCAGAGLGLWWRLRPPPPLSSDAQPGDTGMSEEQRIRLMEEIGYIQQED